MIIIFGLENVLVIVKAVVSTRGNKDVKLKIAEGTHTSREPSFIEQCYLMLNLDSALSLNFGCVLQL